MDEPSQRGAGVPPESDLPMWQQAAPLSFGAVMIWLVVLGWRDRRAA